VLIGSRRQKVHETRSLWRQPQIFTNPATGHRRAVAVMIGSCRQKVHETRSMWRQLQIFTTGPAPPIKHHSRSRHRPRTKRADHDRTVMITANSGGNGKAGAADTSRHT
jgi:hypothetical protein